MPNRGYMVCDYFSDDPPHDNLSIFSYSPAAKAYTHVGVYKDAKRSWEKVTRVLQLLFEYDPQPPFDSGSEAKAGAKVDREARAAFAPLVASAKKNATIARKRLAL